MDKKNIKKLGVVFAIIFIVACISLFILSKKSKIKIGYVGNSYGNNLNASFKYFSGLETKKVKFDAGDYVTITYTIEAEEGGVQLQVKDQSGNEVVSKSGGSGEASFTVSETQVYTINVVATKSKGKFKISWSK